jgi:hypothetical protein
MEPIKGKDAASLGVHDKKPVGFAALCHRKHARPITRDQILRGEGDPPTHGAGSCR